MKSETNTFESIDFRKPPFRDVFIKVKRRLYKEHGRDITADAVRKAYLRGEVIIFEMVKEEVEKSVKNYEIELTTRKHTLKRKEEFEKNVSRRFNMVGAL